MWKQGAMPSLCRNGKAPSHSADKSGLHQNASPEQERDRIFHPRLPFCPRQNFFVKVQNLRSARGGELNFVTINNPSKLPRAKTEALHPMKTFLKSHQLPITLFLVCILVALVSGILAFRHQDVPEVSRETLIIADPVALPEPPPASPDPVSGEPRIPAEPPPESVTLITAAATPAPPETRTSTLPATLFIEEVPFGGDVLPGSTVYDLMRHIEQAGKAVFEFKNFGPGLGYRLESIDGKASDYRAKLYWIYYINGKKATVGISNYTLQPHDIITWKYEPEE